MSSSGRLALMVVSAAAIVGCAHVEFQSDSGLLYFEPVPYLFVARTADCTLTATLVMLPGPPKHLKFTDGYNSSDLSVTLSNGMIASVGQKTDAKVSETITSLAALAAVATARVASAPPAACDKTAMLYEVKDGKIGAAVPFPPP